MYSYQPGTTSFDLSATATAAASAIGHHQNDIVDCLSNYQRHDSIDYSRRPSYFTGLLGSTSEASYSDHEQQTPSPFNSYEDYQQQYHHPLDNNTKRRLSSLVELPHLYQQHQNDMNPSYIVSPWLTAAAVTHNNSSSSSSSSSRSSSPMIYANPAIDMYSPQTYFNQPHHYQQQQPIMAPSYHPLFTPPTVDSTPSVATMESLFRERASSSSSICSNGALSSPFPSAQNTVTSASTNNGNSRRSNTNKANKPLLNKPTRSRGRRVSNNPSIAGQKMFTCKHDDCGKVFKRSEHLKRHVRSIHTLEKPFECPYQSCSKRFSRSDNLNQHIRIHRHTAKDKNNNANNSSTAASAAAALSTTNNRSNSSFSNYMPY